MRRTTIPLHRKRQAALVEALDPSKNRVNPHKGMGVHLLLGTGIRNNTCGHLHKDWFQYIEGELYLQIPDSEPCRKDSENKICGECNNRQGKFVVKTPAGEGRRLHIPNEYTDYSRGERRYFGLRDRCESYFAIDKPDGDGGVGFDMIQANGNNGVTVGTLGDWVRDVCAEAGISKEIREGRIRQEIEVGEDETADEKLDDHGTTDDGRKLPDVFPHDLRATFCTQLCRVDNPNYSKIKQKTGHKDEKTLYRYVGFAASEIDVENDKGMF